MNSTYTPSELVKFFHSVPRLSFKFIFANNPKNFSVKNANYIEGLLATALIPASILLLSVIGFVMFYCCIKFQQVNVNSRKSKPFWSSCLIVFFISIVLCSLGSAIYGSIYIRDGVISTLVALSDIIRSLTTVGSDVKKINMLMDVIKVQSTSLEKDISNNNTVLGLQKFSNALEAVIFNFPFYTENLTQELESILQHFKLADEFRFMITFSLIGFSCLVCIIAIIGVGFSSKCCLISMSFMGQICLVSTYLCISLFFVISTGISDLCLDPTSYIEKEAINQLSIDNVTFRYYLNCFLNDTVEIPYRDVVLQAKKILSSFQGTLRIIQEQVLQSAEKVLSDMNHNCYELMVDLESIQLDFVCQKFSIPMKRFTSSLCSTVLIGLFVNMTSLLSVCVALSFALCAAPKAWKNFKKSNSNDQLENVKFSTPKSYRAWHDDNPRYFRTSENLVLNVNRSPMTSYTKKVPTRSKDSFDQPPPYSPYN